MALDPEPIPVLTLWQPWASLIALGAKRIETRPWATNYRGPLAIHAAVREPDFAEIGDYEIGRLDPGASRRMWRTDVHEPPIDLPLGAIVAVCDLVDVVPMVDDPKARNCLDVRVGSEAAGMAVRRDVPLLDEDGKPIRVRQEHRPEEISDVSDQRPFGDFTPGRFGWLLDNIRPLDEPVPFKGGQRLTRRWVPDR